MSEKILVPVLGESITEATVAKWLKNKGEIVKVDEAIVELETDKVNLEVPSAVNGILTEINAKKKHFMINNRIANKQFSRVSKLEIINKQRVDERKIQRQYLKLCRTDSYNNFSLLNAKMEQNYVVDIHLKTKNSSALKTDKLEETVDYVDINLAVKKEMSIPSKFISARRGLSLTKKRSK